DNSRRQSEHPRDLPPQTLADPEKGSASGVSIRNGASEHCLLFGRELRRERYVRKERGRDPLGPHLVERPLGYEYTRECLNGHERRGADHPATQVAQTCGIALELRENAIQNDDVRLPRDPPAPVTERRFEPEAGDSLVYAQ